MRRTAADEVEELLKSAALGYHACEHRKSVRSTRRRIYMCPECSAFAETSLAETQPHGRPEAGHKHEVVASSVEKGGNPSGIEYADDEGELSSPSHEDTGGTEEMNDEPSHRDADVEWLPLGAQSDRVAIGTRKPTATRARREDAGWQHADGGQKKGARGF